MLIRSGARIGKADRFGFYALLTIQFGTIVVNCRSQSAVEEQFSSLHTALKYGFRVWADQRPHGAHFENGTILPVLEAIMNGPFGIASIR